MIWWQVERAGLGILPRHQGTPTSVMESLKATLWLDLWLTSHPKDVVSFNLGSHSICFGFKYFSAFDWACLVYWNKLNYPRSVNLTHLYTRQDPIGHRKLWEFENLHGKRIVPSTQEGLGPGGTSHLSGETGALHSLGSFFYFVFIAAAVNCHHFTGPRYGMGCFGGRRGRERRWI